MFTSPFSYPKLQNMLDSHSGGYRAYTYFLQWQSVIDWRCNTLWCVSVDWVQQYASSQQLRLLCCWKLGTLGPHSQHVLLYRTQLVPYDNAWITSNWEETPHTCHRLQFTAYSTNNWYIDAPKYPVYNFIEPMYVRLLLILQQQICWAYLAKKHRWFSFSKFWMV